VTMFAEIVLEPGGWIAWLIVGLIAGFLASRVMGSGGFGLIGDIVVGLVGAFIGGILCGMVGVGEYGLIGSIIVAFIGACALICLVRLISPGRTSV